MTTTNNTLEKLLTEHDVASVTGLSVATVRRYRLLRQGPKYLKLNAAVRYRVSDLEAWLASRPVGGHVAQPEPASTGRVFDVTAALPRRRGHHAKSL
jgi:predicted DNA-binding transcriptional regulator AlpA